MLIQFKLVYGAFGQRNMHSTLDFCLRPARKETNVPIHKRSKEQYCPNIYTVSHSKQRTFEVDCLLKRRKMVAAGHDSSLMVAGAIIITVRPGIQMTPLFCTNLVLSRYRLNQN